MRILSKLAVAGLCLAAAGAGGYGYWSWSQGQKLPAGILAANGRLEAEQIDVAAKTAGRLIELHGEEGDKVAAGAVLARLDSAELESQIRSAEAQIRRADQMVAEAQAGQAKAESERLYARQEYDRGHTLNQRGYFATDQLDQRRSKLDVAQAGVKAAEAGVMQSTAAAEVARADLARLRVQMDDLTLRSPRSARVQYKLAQAGEVVAAGGRIFTLLDLSTVYMTVFLPAGQAGRLAIGSEARLILDPVPNYVIPATVTFVAADAQFTPKSVETQQEREKLMFRIKLRIPEALLIAHESQVKTGVRGVAYLKPDQNQPWPEKLAIALPK